MLVKNSLYSSGIVCCTRGLLGLINLCFLWPNTMDYRTARPQLGCDWKEVESKHIFQYKIPHVVHV